MANIVNMRDRPDLVRLLNGGAQHGVVVRIDRRTRWGNPYGEQTLMESEDGFSP